MVYGCVCGALPWSSFQTWISIPLQQDSNAIDRPFVKWWNWNAFQSVFFYGKHSEDGRQMKRTFDKSLRLLLSDQFFLFSRRQHRANNFTQEYCSCSPTTSVFFFFFWNESPFPLKNQKIRNKRSGGGTGNLIRPPLCLFPPQMRRPPFYDWALPWKGSPIINPASRPHLV